jgi:hypothetical protein
MLLQKLQQSSCDNKGLNCFIARCWQHQATAVVFGASLTPECAEAIVLVGIMEVLQSYTCSPCAPRYSFISHSWLPFLSRLLWQLLVGPATGAALHSSKEQLILIQIIKQFVPGAAGWFQHTERVAMYGAAC